MATSAPIMSLGWPPDSRIVEIERANHGRVPEGRDVDRSALRRPDHRTDLSGRRGGKRPRDLRADTVTAADRATQRIDEDLTAPVEHRIGRRFVAHRHDEVDDRFQRCVQGPVSCLPVGRFDVRSNITVRCGGLPEDLSSHERARCMFRPRCGRVPDWSMLFSRLCLSPILGSGIEPDQLVAPGRFSAIILWPDISLNRVAITRPTRSVAAPGGERYDQPDRPGGIALSPPRRDRGAHCQRQDQASELLSEIP